jgi:hypothetical protein
MKFTGTLRAARIDMQKYRAALDACLREAISQGLMEWLEATVIAEVPVWSGASRATFLALARNIEYNIPIFPVVPSRVGQGVSQSSGTLEANAGTGRYIFSYQTTLPWLIVNEYFDATQWGFHLKKPGPYHFQSKGEAAFRKFAERVRLPDPFTCLKTIKIKVSANVG